MAYSSGQAVRFSMASEKYDLVIIGGGAGGLVLALELARKGFQVAILDRQASPMPFPRGEILQPNGLKVLDELGILQNLLRADIHFNKRVLFYRTSGQHLCTIDYGRLSAPYDYSLILLPEVLQGMLLAEMAATPNIKTYWGTTFKGIIWDGGQVAGVEAECVGERLLFQCPMVVGGDGVGSKVRDALRIPYRFHTYQGGYITMVIDRPPGFKEDSRYYLGKGIIFGAFPVSKNRVYLFYLVSNNRLQKVRLRGIDWLKTEICSLHPEIETLFASPLQEITSWDDTAYMPCFRVACDTWVVNGGALLGDAAHAMNPHVAQGRNSAMVDGMILADVLKTCFQRGDFSQGALQRYSQPRQPTTRILQALGDEMVFFWNSGFTPLVWLRDRVFETVQRRPHLHDKLLKTVSGVQVLPFDFMDRWDAIRP